MTKINYKGAKSSLILILFILSAGSEVLLTQTIKDDNGQYYHKLDINNYLAWFSTSGTHFYYNPTNQYGLFWPGGRYAFKDYGGPSGFTFFGKMNDELIVNRFSSGIYLSPGVITSNGTSEDRNNPSVRVFKLQRGWETMPIGELRNYYELDYNEWPVNKGAPWEDTDGNGIYTQGIDKPKIKGDQMLWFSGNTADTSFYPLIPANNHWDEGVKLEVQMSGYGFNRSNILADAIFREYRFINKSGTALDSFFIGIHHQIGGGVVGEYKSFDSLRQMLISYNIRSSVFHFDIPPAYGTLVLVSPKKYSPGHSALTTTGKIPDYKNSEIYSFRPKFDFDTAYFPIRNLDPRKILMNRYTGLAPDGSKFYNPVTGNDTKHFFTGDPVTGNGWNEGTPLPAGISGPSFVMYFSFGPLYMADMDTLDIVLCELAAQGTDNINSIEVLRKKADLIKRAYENNFLTPPAPPSPEVKIYEEEGKVTLWWNDSAESYDIEDFMITGQNLNDTTYSFEGYRIWQFADSLGSDPREIALFDLVNGVTVIEDNIIANGLAVKAPVIIGKDNGIRRYISITKDIFSGSNLIPGLPYYFGVTAYSHNPFSSPSFTESPVKVYTVFPGRKKIDFSSPYSQGESLQAVQTLGSSNNAQVSFKIIDPASVKDGIYHITFSGNPKDSVYYSVTNTTTNELVLSSSVDFSADTLKKSIQQGWMVLVNDPDRTQMNRLPPEQRPFGISRIYSLSPQGREILWLIPVQVRQEPDGKSGRIISR
ncbi:MAG: hypothetical protein HRU80_09570 [Ignavibacteriales bacterium]|nr:MAG: hypothetical protein HRU80_09570 [Ignavibacteriales bacterium]